MFYCVQMHLSQSNAYKLNIVGTSSKFAVKFDTVTPSLHPIHMRLTVWRVTSYILDLIRLRTAKVRSIK